MLIPVVLGGDHEVFPTHIYRAEQPASVVEDRYLRSGFRQSGIDEKQPQRGLPWRGGAAVDKR